MDRYLVLQNGSVFKGTAFGADLPATGAAQGTVPGEVVFTTGMTGYLETLSDPAYAGQIVLQTFPLIGCYGVIPQDFESPAPALRAYIAKYPSNNPSNFRSEGTLHEYLKAQGIPGLCGIDTRALTLLLREEGVMNGAVADDPSKVDLEALRSYSVEDAVAQVTLQQPREDIPVTPYRRAVLWDFGAKARIRRELVKRGCEVISVPASYTAQQVLALRPEGVLLSDGPGDPAQNAAITAEIEKLLQHELPVFATGLGHQLLALACGGRTGKLKCGHRGANHPVRDLKTGQVFTTGQNHGYVVEIESIDMGIAAPRYENANDGTCEGIDYTAFPAFSVQFHPEAAGGPLEPGFLFDRFVDMMEGRHAAQ